MKHYKTLRIIIMLYYEKLHVEYDDVYDSNDNFGECEKQNAILVRKNFSSKSKWSTTRKQQRLIQFENCEINQKNVKIFNQFTNKQKLENRNKWKIEMGYGRRWSAEIAFSTWKKILDKNISVKICVV